VFVWGTSHEGDDGGQMTLQELLDQLKEIERNLDYEDDEGEKT
jgi:hypothetical protein